MARQVGIVFQDCRSFFGVVIVGRGDIFVFQFGAGRAAKAAKLAKAFLSRSNFSGFSNFSRGGERNRIFRDIAPD